MSAPALYPVNSIERRLWIEERRVQRAPLDPQRPYAFLVEQERAVSGEIVPVATIFLTNRECPWRCVMCDLWRNTLIDAVPSGAVPTQLDYALGLLPAARQVKLYNSGSFFDPRAVPPGDYEAIAARLSHFENVIVECHPALVGESMLRFRDLISGTLEVAMGLETAHPEVLERLNKQMTLDQFADAARKLKNAEVGLRAFILVQPPFMDPEEAFLWAARSVDFAFGCGATAAVLIPTRSGNGAMETLQANGEFRPPPIAVVESAAEYGLNLERGRVFVDLWDMPNKVSGCAACRSERVARLLRMNLSQMSQPAVFCSLCEGAAS